MVLNIYLFLVVNFAELPNCFWVYGVQMYGSSSKILLSPDKIPVLAS